MKRLASRSIPVSSWFQKPSRYYPLVGLLLIGLVALMACAPAASPTPTPTPAPTPEPEMVAEPAPVESVNIEVTGSDPISAELVLVTGLPGGCHEFDDYTLERDGDNFHVTVTNLRPADESIPCTTIYGYHETRVALPGEIEACETYDVVVNDETYSARAEGPAVTCEAETSMRQEPAPVESVSVVFLGSDPVSAELVLVTGLPGGCHEFDSYTLEPEGDTFRVTVTNLRPADETIPCTDIYGYHETRVALPGDIEFGDYTVVVNGEPFLVHPTIYGEGYENGGPMRREPAPIENVTIDVQSIEPLRVSMEVVSGLPNACYAFDSYTISRDGDTFNVEVLNVVPEDPDLMCAEVYGTETSSIPMEWDIQVCHTYTVNINDETHQVQAISPNVRCANGEPVTGTDVMVGLGQSAAVEDSGLTVTLLEVTEDSRCPSDAICVHAGQATVLALVEQDGEDLGEVSLTLTGGEGSTAETLEGYTFWLVRLDPYPVSTADIDPQDYVAHILVSSPEQPDA